MWRQELQRHKCSLCKTVLLLPKQAERQVFTKNSLCNQSKTKNSGQWRRQGQQWHKISQCPLYGSIRDRRSKYLSLPQIEFPVKMMSKKCMISQKKCRCVSMMKTAKKRGEVLGRNNINNIKNNICWYRLFNDGM